MKINWSTPMTQSSFADRFWFARRAANIGSPTLMRLVAQAIGQKAGDGELSPSLISTIERKDQKSSRYNDAFASVLKVDAKWLATGEGSAPRGFNATEARAGRIAETGKNRRGAPIEVVSGATPDWAAPDEDEDTRVQRKQADLTRDLIDFAILVGPEHMTGFLRSVEPLLASFGAKAAGKTDTRRP